MTLQKTINILRLSEAMDLIYKTIILDEESAELRGQVIRGLDALIIAQGGVELSGQIEQTPWSLRMRKSGEDDLIEYEKTVHAIIAADREKNK